MLRKLLVFGPIGDSRKQLASGSASRKEMYFVMAAVGEVDGGETRVDSVRAMDAIVTRGHSPSHYGRLKSERR
jgi:hypothetical protein